MITVKMDMLGIPRLPRLSAADLGEAADSAASGVQLAVAKKLRPAERTKQQQLILGRCRK